MFVCPVPEKERFNGTLRGALIIKILTLKVHTSIYHCHCQTLLSYCGNRSHMGLDIENGTRYRHMMYIEQIKKIIVHKRFFFKQIFYNETL